jgi:hypothetical protein
MTQPYTRQALDFARKMAPLTTRSVNSQELTEHASKDFEKELQTMMQDVAAKIHTGQDKETLESCAKVLSAIADVETSLPRAKEIEFSLTRWEVAVLIVYAAGGLLFRYLAQLVTPGLAWKGADAATLIGAWSAVVAVLLGAQALPQILGGGSSGQGKGGGGEGPNLRSITTAHLAGSNPRTLTETFG